MKTTITMILLSVGLLVGSIPSRAVADYAALTDDITPTPITGFDKFKFGSTRTALGISKSKVVESKHVDGKKIELVILPSQELTFNSTIATCECVGVFSDGKLVVVAVSDFSWPEVEIDQVRAFVAGLSAALTGKYPDNTKIGGVSEVPAGTDGRLTIWDDADSEILLEWDYYDLRVKYSTAAGRGAVDALLAEKSSDSTSKL